MPDRSDLFWAMSTIQRREVRDESGCRRAASSAPARTRRPVRAGSPAGRGNRHRTRRRRTQPPRPRMRGRAAAERAAAEPRWRVENTDSRRRFPAPSATKRVRARLTRRMSGQRSGSRRRAAPCSSRCSRCTANLHPKADLKLVQRAYEVAEKAHSGQFRRSGDPYITHPLAVATILADLGMDTTTLVAALLHDTVEDTPYTLKDADRRLRRRGRPSGRRRDQAGQGPATATPPRPRPSAR